MTLKAPQVRPPEPRETIEYVAAANMVVALTALAAWISCGFTDYYVRAVLLVVAGVCFLLSTPVSAIIFFSRRGERTTRLMWVSISAAVATIGCLIWVIRRP